MRREIRLYLEALREGGGGLVLLLLVALVAMYMDAR